MPTSRTLLVFVALLGACINPKPAGDDTGGGDDTGTGDSGPTVYGANDGTIAVDTVVTLENVVVTSPITRDGEGFFIADPRGGAQSGLYVWRAMGMDDVVVSEGDELRVTGTLTDYYGWREFVVDSTDDIEVTGEADVPAPEALGDGSGVDWEQYESVAVQLDSQRITSVNEYNTATLSAGIALDDGFVLNDYDCGGTYDSVTGIIFYTFKEHSLNARTEDELVNYLAPEAAPATIEEIQAGTTCGPVILEDVVATTPNADDKNTSTFFVQSADGTGVAIYSGQGTIDVAPGDVMTVIGDTSEYYGLTEIYVADPADITIDGTESVVSTELDAAPDDWEAYEGWLVTLNDVEITSDGSYGEFETSWGITLDTMYYEYDVSNGDTFSSITGVVSYNYKAFKLEPRSAADMVE